MLQLDQFRSSYAVALGDIFRKKILSTDALLR